MENNDLRNAMENIGMVIGRFTELGEQMGRYFSEVLKQIDFEVIEKKLQIITEKIENMPELIIKSQDILFSRGWYVFGEFAIADFTAVIEMDNDEIEELMTSYAKDIKANTLKRLSGHFPKRAKIVAEAFLARDNNLYCLSIPVLLAQADGISNELLGESLYTKKYGEPRTKKARFNRIKKEDEYLTDLILLRPLDVITSLSINTSDRDKKMKTDKSFGPLNRHGVMHGLDFDYDTESNSLRCMVLLAYLMDLYEYYFKV